MDVDRDAFDDDEEQERESWVEQENRRPRDMSSSSTTDGTEDRVEVQRKTSPTTTTGKIDLAPDVDVIISSQLSTQVVVGVFRYTAAATATVAVAATTSSFPPPSEDIDMV